MKVQPINNQYFNIDANNNFTRSSKWRLSADDLGVAPNAFASEVETWCDIIGEDLLVPSSSGEPVTVSDCLISEVKITSVSMLCAEVTLISAPVEVIITPPEFSEFYSDDGTYKIKSIYTSNSETLALPVAGDVLEWSYGDLCCESSSAEALDSGGWEITITGIPTGATAITQVIYDTDSYGTESATCSWFVTSDSYEDFIADCQIDDVATWAGDNYSVRSVKTKNQGIVGMTVTAIAQKVTTRMLECTRHEEFAGVDILNQKCYKVLWRSRWRVLESEMDDWESTTGAAASWAHANSILTVIKPKKISAIEYEVELEAELKSNPGLFNRYDILDNRSNLSGRRDVDVYLCDFFITYEMIGWQRRYDRVPVLIEDWDYENLCPFIVTGPLEVTLGNRNAKAIMLEESTYHTGDIGNNIDTLFDWSEGELIVQGTKGGHSGYFRKEDIKAKEVVDNNGKIWTRITALWMLAPGDRDWNSAYWGNM